jgi:bifunctional non-homologous end joining protein LigD
VAWRDLERKGIGPRDYTVKNVFHRLVQRDDPWATLRRRGKGLGRAREHLEPLRAQNEKA